LVGRDVLENLQRRELRRKQPRHAVEQKVPCKIDETSLAVGEGVEADVEKAVGNDVQRGSISVSAVVGVLPSGTKEELISMHTLLGIENWLARNKNIAPLPHHIFRGVFLASLYRRHFDPFFREMTKNQPSL
jgi:hypothetical protein